MLKVLKPGEAIFVSFSRLPDSRLVTLGEHFVFDPPRKGRPPFMEEMEQIGAVQDLGRAARLEAKVPLLLTIDCPWMDATNGLDILGCGVILHMRLARNTPLLADMAFAFAENAPEKKILRWDGYKLRIAASESGKLTEVVVGGPAYAAVYEDEVVVPGYRTTDKEGNDREPLPYAYIIHQDEVGPLEYAFRQEGRAKALVREAAKAGAPVQLGMQAVGQLKTITIDKISISADTTGRIFGIAKGDIPLHSVNLNVGQRRELVTLVLRQMVTHPVLRERLGLTELPQAESMPRRRPAQDGLTKLDKVFAEIDAEKSRVPAKVVAPVERRKEKPKLGPVVQQSKKKTEEQPQQPVSTSLVALGGRAGGHLLGAGAGLALPVMRSLPMWPGQQPPVVVLPPHPEEPLMRNVTPGQIQGRGLPAPVNVSADSDVEDLASL